MRLLWQRSINVCLILLQNSGKYLTPYLDYGFNGNFEMGELFERVQMEQVYVDGKTFP